jgi:hypothetical protein
LGHSDEAIGVPTRKLELCAKPRQPNAVFLQDAAALNKVLANLDMLSKVSLAHALIAAARISSRLELSRANKSIYRFRMPRFEGVKVAD